MIKPTPLTKGWFGWTEVLGTVRQTKKKREKELKKLKMGIQLLMPSWMFPDAEERSIAQSMVFPFKKLWEEMGYFHVHSTRPQTLVRGKKAKSENSIFCHPSPRSQSFGLVDSAMGLAAWMGEKFHAWAKKPISLAQQADHFSLYWFSL